MIRRSPAAQPAPADDVRSHRSLSADLIIANAPDPVFVSDLEGKILQANDAVSGVNRFPSRRLL
jgi:PAS domain-containing protein